MKIVINRAIGNFDLSNKAKIELAKLNGQNLYFYKTISINKFELVDPEDDHILINVFTKNFGKIAENIDFDYVFKFPKRNDENLIKVVEELGKEANTKFGNLKIVEIPDDVEWEIKEYYGEEWVAEKHRTWR